MKNLPKAGDKYYSNSDQPFAVRSFGRGRNKEDHSLKKGDIVTVRWDVKESLEYVPAVFCEELMKEIDLHIFLRDFTKVEEEIKLSNFNTEPVLVNPEMIVELLDEVELPPLSIEGVTIGDVFYTKIGKSKIKSEVVDFVKSYSLYTGETVEIKVIAKVYGFSNTNTWETTFEDVLSNKHE